MTELVIAGRVATDGDWCDRGARPWSGVDPGRRDRRGHHRDEARRPGSRTHRWSMSAMRSCCPGSSTCTTTSPTTRCRCGPSRVGRSRGCTTSTGRTPTPTPSRSPNRPGSMPRPARRRSLGYVQVRAMAGGASSVQGWPTANRGYPTVVRNVDAEDAGTGRDDLIYTSVVTKTGDALATAVRRMGDGSGFIYHCSEGQRDSAVLKDYTEPRGRRRAAADVHRHPLLCRGRGELGEVGRRLTRVGWCGHRCRTWSSTPTRR